MLSLSPEILGEARRLWSPVSGAAVTLPTSPAPDSDWALVFDKRWAWAYDGEVPPPDEEGHVYPVFRQAAYVLACRFAEVGADPSPARVGALLLKSWEASGKDGFERALMGCCSGATSDHDGGFHDVPEADDKEVDRIQRVACKTDPKSKGKAYSLDSPPTRRGKEEMRTWLYALLDRLRANGYSNVGIYHAALDAAEAVGMGRPQLWAKVRTLGERGGAARRHRAAALERHCVLSRATATGDRIPVVLEGPRDNYILDFKRNQYRTLHRGLRGFESQLRAASKAMPEDVRKLIDIYLEGEPEDRATAERLLFAQVDGVPSITLVGDADPETVGLGYWVSPGVWKLIDRRSVMDPSIPPQFIPEVDMWLRSLGGTEGEALLDWLALSGDTSVPCCALALVGTGDAGKSLLGTSLSALFGGTAATMSEKTGTYHDGLERSHLVMFDEGLENMGSARFRELITSRRHSVNIKGKSILDVTGHYRLITSANDVDKILPSSTSFSTEAGDAIAKRLLVVRVTPQSQQLVLLATAACDRIAGVKRYDKRAPIVARHIRWLIENRKADVLARWAASGSQQLAIKGGNLDEMRVEIEVRANHEAYSTLERLMDKGYEPVQLDDGRWFVPSRIDGRAIVDDMFWASGSQPRTTVQRRIILRDAWGKPSRHRVGGEQLRGYVISPDLLIAAGVLTGED
jgi:hypothetical protein